MQSVAHRVPPPKPERMALNPNFFDKMLKVSLPAGSQIHGM
jgi:hypothetical protein